MSAGEVAAIVAAVAFAILVVGLLFALGVAMRTMAELRRTLEDLRQQSVPLLTEAQTAVRQANGALGQVDTILERADSISGTVDSASKLACRAFATPLIKAMALASGGARAVRAFRDRG